VLDEVKRNPADLGAGDIDLIIQFIQTASDNIDHNRMLGKTLNSTTLAGSPASSAFSETSRGSSETSTPDLVKTISSLTSVPDLWRGLPQDNLLSQVDRLQDTVDQLGNQLLQDNVDKLGNQLLQDNVDQLGNQLLHQPPLHPPPDSDLQVVVSHLNRTAPAIFQDGESSMSVDFQQHNNNSSSSNNNITTPVVFKSFRKLGCIINRQVSCTEPLKNQTQVNSHIIGANLHGSVGASGKPHGDGNNVSVTIRFSHIHPGDKYSLSSVRCVYWSSLVRGWEGAGCSLVSTTPSHSTCACNHLTNFAVIMDIGGIIQNSELAPLLNLISLVCLPMSLVGLLLSLLTFTIIPGLRSVRNSIHVHLCLSLFLAHTLTLTAIQATEPATLCVSVAVCLHFLYLSCFSWMLMEGWHVYRLLVDVFQSKQIGLLFYCGLGYGLPALTVLVSFVTSQLLELEGYGGESFCWLNTQNGFIWAFGGPVAAILLANLAIFSLAMVVSRKAIKRNTNMEEKARFVSWLKGSTSLISILGLSWIFGFLYSYQGSEWMAVIFTLINSLQGVSIFLMHVIFNLQVRKKAYEYLSRKIRNVEHTSTYHSRTSTRRGTRRKKLDRNTSEMTIVDLNLNSSSQAELSKAEYGDALSLAESGDGNSASVAESGCAQSIADTGYAQSVADTIQTAVQRLNSNDKKIKKSR